jgi:hypothetical protein
MTDIARHLPQEQAPQVAEEIRGLVSTCKDSRTAGSLLLALGALGSAADLPLVIRFLEDGAPIPAIRAIEGQATVALIEGLMRISVQAGKARVFKGGIPVLTMKPDESGDFLDDNPMGRVER